MKKIIIIGSPGAGKSVFSKKLHHITKLPLYHLDMLYHKKDGTHISKEKLPQIYMLLDKYKNNKDIIIFKNRKEADTYIRELANKYNCDN